MGHRRDVLSGDTRACSVSGTSRGEESGIGSEGIRAVPRDGSEDAAVCGATGLSATTTDQAFQARPWLGVIDAILEDDKRRPANQRHTAKRIFDRLKKEHQFTGGYTIVKDYVRGEQVRSREVFVPLTHAPGEAQADFGEALVVVAGVEQKAHYLAIDLPHSDDCFVVAFPA
jgi:transposase